MAAPTPARWVGGRQVGVRFDHDHAWLDVRLTMVGDGAFHLPVTRRPAAQLGAPRGVAERGRRDRADHGGRHDRPAAAEAEEPRRLREENAELRRANEILEAASALFAQEVDPARKRS
ncbi:mobile element protein [Pseudonocardia sp. N23]|nr:mobile element protein [Pseudonocardia sp. N23]